MNSPPAARPSTPPVLAAHQTSAEGHKVELRSWDGRELIRKVSSDRVEILLDAGLVVWCGQHLRLKLGIRWIPELDFTNGRPDLKHMRDREPERYETNWLGMADARTGQGCLGRRCDDETLHTAAADPAGKHLVRRRRAFVGG